MKIGIEVEGDVDEVINVLRLITGAPASVVPYQAPFESPEPAARNRSPGPRSRPQVAGVTGWPTTSRPG